jgi:hypothetical protein
MSNMRTYQAFCGLTILALLCLCSESVLGQTNRRSSASSSANKIRAVTVTTKNGETLSGNLLQINNDSLRLTSEGSSRIVKLDEVTSIIFNSDSQADTTTGRSVRLSPQAKTSASKALKSLRKLAGATEIGITFQEYGTRLIDINAEVDEALASLPEGVIKQEISLALQAYVDAGKAWNVTIQHGSQYGRTVTLWLADFIDKYSVPHDDLAVNNNVMLSTIWQAARTHLDRASALVGQ